MPLNIKKISEIEAVAPSHLCNTEFLQIITNWLKNKNIDLVINANIIDACQDNQLRIFDKNIYEQAFLSALNNKQNILLWAIRGGYGAMRLLPLLQNLPKPKTPKIFIGSSDATALHLFFLQEWGWKTIHGTMLAANAEIAEATEQPNLVNANASINSVLQLLANQKYQYKISPANKLAENSNPIKAELVGGNVSLICASMGTKNQISSKNKILILEEINEHGYSLERMLLQLQQGNILQEASAVCFGEMLFTGSQGQQQNLTNHLLMKQFFNELNIPCFTIADFGHGKNNLPVILGAEHFIEHKNNQWQLKCDET